MRCGVMVRLFDINMTKQDAPKPAESLPVPPLQDGISAALRQAFVVPLNERTAELDRLIARLH